MKLINLFYGSNQGWKPKRISVFKYLLFRYWYLYTGIETFITIYIGVTIKRNKQKKSLKILKYVVHVFITYKINLLFNIESLY